ncbi:unnamed protein product [Pipistrellus nathusii]|uniref:Uncharacterized protein n=1 Tax=Pipistrellus nathusii TaxID=59473 RepID=A0ABN9ZEF2_PIPNA
MAKVTKKSWERKSTSTRRWKKKKTRSQPKSRRNNKVLKIYKKIKRPFHMTSRKKYSPKVKTTSRRRKRERRANRFQP